MPPRSHCEAWPLPRSHAPLHLRSYRAGGGRRVRQGRISVSQILCEIFVCNLFGVFQDLHGSVRLCPCSLSPRQRIWLMIVRFPWKSQKCRSSFPSFAVFLWHSMGCRPECWLMHQESPPGNISSRPLFLMRKFCQLCVICSLIFKEWYGSCRARTSGLGFSRTQNISPFPPPRYSSPTSPFPLSPTPHSLPPVCESLPVLSLVSMNSVRHPPARSPPVQSPCPPPSSPSARARC